MGTAQAPGHGLGQAGEITCRAYQAGDELGILALFERVFGQRRSLEHWRWKFERNPAGRHVSVAATADGKIVGQFAGLPARAIGPRGAFVLTQGIDHMVDPDFQGKGIFAALTQHFLQSFCPPEGAVTFWGVNLERKHELDKRLFAMELVRPLDRLELDLAAGDGWAPAPLRRPSARVRFEALTRFDSSLDVLWSRCHPIGIATVRDAAYLNWRYAESPDVGYALLAARRRWSGQICGVAVLRGGWLGEPVAAVVDWLVPREEQGLQRRLLLACHRWCRASGFERLVAWARPGSPLDVLLRSAGYGAVSSPFLLSALSGRGPVSVAELRDAWDYSIGDSDLS